MMTSSPLFTTRRTLAACAIALSIGLAGCATGPRLVTPEPPPIPEGGGTVPAGNVTVLEGGQQVVANTAAGRMKIEAGPGLRRVFTWNGLRRGAIVEARSKPFAGAESEGITFDGTPEVWEDAGGITKLRYEEGVQNYANVDDATIWMQIRRLYFVYNDEGLVLGWRREGDTLHVELWQFMIDGQKPTSMPDSHSDRITKGPLVVEPQKMYPHLVFADGHTEVYDEEARAKYNAQRGGGQGKTSCNFFEKLFQNCKPAAVADTDDASTSGAGATAGATTGAATAAGTAASGGQAAGAADTETAKPEPAPSKEMATISGNVVNIRGGASTNDKVLFQARKGDKVEILKRENDWRYVEFSDGRKGWVANFLLKE